MRKALNPVSFGRSSIVENAYQRQKLAEGSDGSPPPLARFAVQFAADILRSIADQHRMQPELCRSAELIIFAVGYIEAALRRNTEALAGELKNAWIRFFEAVPARENRGVH